MSREDDFQERRKHLANLTEEELEQRFWELAGKIVDPIVELARNNTSPSIERSVSVSYTHLDVYKRQVVRGLPHMKRLKKYL